MATEIATTTSNSSSSNYNVNNIIPVLLPVRPPRGGVSHVGRGQVPLPGDHEGLLPHVHDAREGAKDTGE